MNCPHSSTLPGKRACHGPSTPTPPDMGCLQLLPRVTTLLAVLLLLSAAAAPSDAARHPPGVGHHPPGVGHHKGHHPPGRGHRGPKQGHHPLGVGGHRWNPPPPPSPLPSPPDYCAEIGAALRAGRAVTVAASLQCLDSFPLDPASGNATLDALETYIGQVYVFRDLNAPGGGAALLAELQRMRRRAWPSERAFDLALYELVRSPHDGHLAYFAKCSNAIGWYHAFPVVAVLDDEGRQIVKISPLAGTADAGYPATLAATEQALNITVADYAGLQVAAIAGMDPVQYLLSPAAQPFSGNRDASAQLNAAVSHIEVVNNGTALERQVSGGSFVNRAVVAPPASLRLTYLTPDGKRENIDVPFFADNVGKPFGSSAEFRALNCESSGSSATSSNSRLSPPRALNMVPTTSASSPSRLFGRASGRWQTISSSLSSSSSSAANLLQPRQEDDSRVPFVQPGVLDDGTGVMVIPTFDVNFDRFNTWLVDLDNAVQILQANNCTRVILDLSQNGGGAIYLAHSLVNRLFPQSTGRDLPPLATIMRASPLIERLVNKSSPLDGRTIFGALNFADLDNVPFADSASQFFYPAQARTFNGATANYSSPFKDAFSPPFRSTLEAPFEAENILFLTDGNCFSSCALVGVNLVQRYGVRTVAAGGRAAGPAAPYNVVGGQVYDSSTFQDDVNVLRLGEDPSVPAQFDRPVQLYFTLRAAFGPKNSQVPAEFLYQTADVQLPYTDDTVFDLVTLYSEVAKYF
eukprot:jgi/Mesen1/9069/ME000578S08307